MTQVRKTITISAQQDAWLKSLIASGDYASDSEIIRDLIRKEQRTDKGDFDFDKELENFMEAHGETMEKLAK